MLTPPDVFPCAVLMIAVLVFPPLQTYPVCLIRDVTLWRFFHVGYAQRIHYG